MPHPRRTIEPVMSRGREVHPCVIERVSLLFHEVSEDVVAPRFQIHACRRKLVADGRLVNMLLLHLLFDKLCHLRSLAHEPLIAATGISIQVEIAVAHHGMSRIPTRQHVQIHVAGIEAAVFLHDIEVAHAPVHLVVVIQVGLYVNVSTEAHVERLIHSSQLIEVGAVYPAVETGIQAVAVHGSVNVEITADKRNQTVLAAVFLQMEVAQMTRHGMPVLQI